MPSTVPAPFEALFAGSSEGDRAAVDLLCSLVDASSEVVLEVERDARAAAARRCARCCSARSITCVAATTSAARSAARRRAPCCSPWCTWAPREIAGYEALSDLSTRDLEGTDSWFRDAAVLGLGEEFELVLLTLALEELQGLPGRRVPLRQRVPAHRGVAAPARPAAATSTRRASSSSSPSTCRSRTTSRSTWRSSVCGGRASASPSTTRARDSPASTTSSSSARRS